MEGILKVEKCHELNYQIKSISIKIELVHNHSNLALHNM